jgi:hypothetical protein
LSLPLTKELAINNSPFFQPGFRPSSANPQAQNSHHDHGYKITIPLVRPDLNQEDEARFLHQIEKNPFQDIQLLARWEAAWQDIWQRPCLAFADPTELILCLKKVLDWPSGQKVQTSPLLHPIWQEAMQSSWLAPTGQVVIADSGQEIYTKTTNPPHIQAPCLIQHHFGLPVATDPNQHISLEDISAILKPLPTTGMGVVQLLMLDGNRMLQGGGDLPGSIKR